MSRFYIHIYECQCEYQMESPKLGLTNIPDRLSTKDSQLILNFPNISGN